MAVLIGGSLRSAPGGTVNIPPIDTTTGYVALLLINEVPFPGERFWISEADTKTGMRQIVLVLEARLNDIPPRYTQRQIAMVKTDSVIDVMTAGGEHGQVEGFFRDESGRATVTARVVERFEYLRRLANEGPPGRFARLIQHANMLAEQFVAEQQITPDLYLDLRWIDDIAVTGRAYSWMTQGNYHPGGRYIRIPDSNHGGAGGNRFFTLRKLD